MQDVRQLSKEFSPTNYNLSLKLDRKDRAFTGQVTIVGDLQQAVDTITIHAKKLTIDKVLIDGQPASAQPGQNDEIALVAQSTLSATAHTVELTFAGAITDPMNGLYPCYFTQDGQKQELLATQFESHAAREVFPCIDEPAAKATFDLTLTTESGVTVISNTPIKTQSQTADELMVTQFEQTPKMSTYLLAWVVGQLDYREAKTADGTIVRAYATRDHIADVQFSLDTAVRTLELFNEFFGTPYPLPKCDMVALPDFAAGAMENWGCITYRETAFFVNEFTSVGTKQRIAETVAHELAHQWFGNLVTMQWWNDLWLNESFATWMAAYARDKLFPEWQTWTQFYNEEIAYALDRDALKSIQSVQQDVHHPDEIRTLFDSAIVYGKGASLVHMVHGFMGAEAFQAGLQAYMKQHAYGNAAAADLWTAWSAASGKDISAFMTPWIRQPGHPLVHVAIEGQKVTLSQERFFNNFADYAAKDDTLWPVPVLAEGLATPLLVDASHTETYQASTPLLINKGRTGFYAPLYSPEHLQLLAAEVAAGRLDILDRLALLNDAYDLAKAGQQSTLQLVQLLASYTDESSEPVWGAMAGGVGALKTVINDDDELRPYVQKFAAKLAHSQYERLGWAKIEGEPYFDQLLRSIILGLMGYSEEPEVIATAKQLFAAAQKPTDILGDIRSIVLSLNARHGDQATFDRLLAMLKVETSPEVRTQLTAGLCSTKDPEHIQQLISLIRSDTVKPQDIFYWLAYLSRNKYAKQAIWTWVQQEWAWLHQTFSSDGHISDFPRYIAGSFATRAELADFERFFGQWKNDPLLGREIKQGIESITARIAWRERDLEQVANYLRTNPDLVPVSKQTPVAATA